MKVEPLKYQFDKQAFVSEIVKKDYHTALVFRRHGIEYCCGARLPLETVCNLKNLDLETIQAELESTTTAISLPPFLKMNEWELSFLTDYIVHIHHAYLKTVFPTAIEIIQQFSDSHEKKYRYLPEVVNLFTSLAKELLALIKYEEDIIFPYIQQIAHAKKTGGAYARLLVRTLSKPVEEVMHHEQQFVMDLLGRLRALTSQYEIPADACPSHRVCFLSMQEIDRDIMQQFHIENDILFPGVIQMEKDLLKNIYL
jgi:regulator of cell morphogenesis and NO signaling